VAGEVLEIGVGTGLNLTLYQSARRVIALDPDPRMLQKAPQRARQAPVPTDLLLADGQRLPFNDDSFDSVVATLVFCTIPDPTAGMEEVRRVLRPGGRFLLVEHVLSPSPFLARIQRWLDPWWTKVAGGCHLDRETFRTVQQSGFDVRRVTLLMWKHVLVIDTLLPATPA
jgi:ubiquinone/menaquinone biosynthesis C-methylase UbiE